MLMFTAADHERVANGEITVTWRLWKYAHVKTGRVYASGFPFGGAIAIDDVREVRARDVTEADAIEAGHRNAASLIEFVRGHTGRAVEADTALYRVQFHFDRESPPKPQYSMEEIVERVERLDKVSRAGPWTLQALRVIEENPGVVSRYLAPELGMARDDFKANVRKLKGLGLTLSLPVGYELTELGQAYLDSLDAGPTSSP